MIITIRQQSAGRLLPALVALALVAHTAVASAHDLPVGASRWRFGRSAIVAAIDLGPVLLAQIAGLEDVPLDSMSDERLERVRTSVIQPYVDARLSVSEDGKPRPVNVDRLVRNGNVYTIWLTIENAACGGAMAVSIDYRLLFDETDRAHMNLAYGYLSDATGDALQKLFDFSPPAVQFTFEVSAHVWNLTVPAAGASAAPSVASHPARRKQVAKTPLAAAPVAAPALSPQPAPAVAPSPLTPEPPPPAPLPLAAASSAWRQTLGDVARFVVLGIEHILTGYDHIAFLVALVVVAPSLRAVLPIITAFTAAHSITLLLAALRIVHVPSRVVESAIAISICYVAAENLLRKRGAHRWLVTFCFGLVHGFGFASALQELIVGKAHLVVSVVSFNVGVELGQLMIFACLLPVLRVLAAVVEPRKTAAAASMVIGLLGCTWVVERGLDVKLLPFF